MAEVIFMTGVDDVLGYAGRLIRKKYREGARLAIYGPSSMLDALDVQLWRQDPLDFLPHCRVSADGSAEPSSLPTPIWLLDRPLPEALCTLAVNLGLDDLQFVDSHQRVAEIVGTQEVARRAGRDRWKQYERAGHALKHIAQARTES